VAQAHADLTIDGPGITVHVHGDGAALFADVRCDVRNPLRVLRTLFTGLRLVRPSTRVLRQAGMTVTVRIGRRRIATLG
jgi:hypothetical protein